MKNTLHTIALLIITANIYAQPFNFYSSVYFTSPDNGTSPGTALTSSSTDLSLFNFSTASDNHPMFTTGLYYAVQDCSNQNLWVRVRHVADDPNGPKSGLYVSNTMNSPFLPNGATDRIGGWYGFLYDFQIFQDQVLIGERSNILGNPFPTNITVASLETLYNDGGTMFEWLSFEILNEETGGWYLNSTNFTGINPFSTPGFSADLNYSTTGTSSSAPTGFSTDFPNGSPTVYAVDMNLSGSYHSEFKMSASGVSQFQYGYEFTSGGYQGMSMEFGVPPVINAEINPSCGKDQGSIGLEITAAEPITFDWENGNDTSLLTELSGGDYTVTVTDGNGCSVTQTYTVDQFGAVELSISAEEVEDGTQLTASFEGGTEPIVYEWSTEQIGQQITVIPGEISMMITVEATDANGCQATAQYLVVNIEEHQQNTTVSIYPNPVREHATITFSKEIKQLRILDSLGKIVHQRNINSGILQFDIDLSKQPSGIYHYQLIDAVGRISRGKLIVE